uniref:Helicase C-terminal domain-containing protein n=1 Tax=Nelumbo nucifera TaxID=4432 RepID=A0A822YWU0_NELNU|nr:TPA_asm: hypothetical protein HUJ06_005856 [Nelumbo nucifera]
MNCFQIHGQQNQQKWTSTFFDFCNVENGILLCTNVAARGIDICGVSVLEDLVANNYYLNQSAKDAYRSYISADNSHSMKDVFNVYRHDLQVENNPYGRQKDEDDKRQFTRY